MCVTLSLDFWLGQRPCRWLPSRWSRRKALQLNWVFERSQRLREHQRGYYGPMDHE